MAGRNIGYLAIQNFRFGLDARRSELTSQPGTLLRAVDCHVNQGAELEKRKAIVKTLLPTGVFVGLSALDTQYVFGSIPNPGVPVGFTYQQLISPFGSAMSELVSVTLFNGKPFVLAAFGNDGTFAFFDGNIIQDQIAGEVTAGHVTTIQTTAPGSGYGAGTTVNITGGGGVGATAGFINVFGSLSIFLINQGSGYTSNPNVVITGGGGVGAAASAYIAQSPEQQALNLAALVNATGNYTATVNGTLVTVSGINGNNFSITDALTTAAGTVRLAQQSQGVSKLPSSSATAKFSIIAGMYGTGTPPYVQTVIINSNGFNILAGNVPWTGDPTSMAAQVAASINAAFLTNGNFTALASGTDVTVYAPAGVAQNGMNIQIDTQLSSNNDGAICTQSALFSFVAEPGVTLTISSITSAALGILTNTSRSLSSFASLSAMMNQIAVDILAYTVAHSGTTVAVNVGGNLYISSGADISSAVTDVVSLNFTSTGALTISGVVPLTVTAFPAHINTTQGAAVTVKGGVAPYTYSWNNSPSNTLFISFNSPSSAGTEMILSGSNFNTSLAICTITDASKQTATVVVSVNAG